jgi:hypothetical protein
MVAITGIILTGIITIAATDLYHCDIHLGQKLSYLSHCLL